MKKPKKQVKRLKWDSFMIVDENDTWYEIGGDGFLLEDKLHRLRGKYPNKRFEIIVIKITSSSKRKPK